MGGDDFTEEEMEEMLREAEEQEAEERGAAAAAMARELTLSGHCLHCHSLCQLDQQMLANFDISVCFPCRKSKPEEYARISKTRAGKEYLLNDQELAKLKSVCVRNPNLDRHNDMRLFLLKQVKESSFALWGGSEGLEAEREKRRERMEARARKKPKFSLVPPKEKTSNNNARDGEAVSRLLSVRSPAAATTAVNKTAAVIVPNVLTRAHKHRFLAEPVSTGNEDEYERQCAECGFREVFESF